MERARPFSLLVAILVVVGMLTATPAVAEGGAESAADPMAGAPKAGQCYLTKPKQNDAVSLEQAPISCKKKHTVWVLDAIEVSEAEYADLSNQVFSKRVLRTCRSLMTKAVGKPKLQALSAYQLFTFLPTTRQAADGSRWLTCAVGVWAKAPALQTSTARKPVKLTRSMPAKTRSCLTAKRSTNCAQGHAWRAVHAEAVTWPRSESKTIKLAQKVCSPRVSSRKFRYGAYVAGAKSTPFLVCYTRSSR